VYLGKNQRGEQSWFRAAITPYRVNAPAPNDHRALLEPILAAMEGGETTRDVRAARALLADIA
jgi:hypothetical protein